MRKAFFLLSLPLMSMPGAASAMQQPAAVPAPAPASREKMICKKTLEIGSLVKKKKTCLSASQWNRLSEESQNMGREMQARSERGG